MEKTFSSTSSVTLFTKNAERIAKAAFEIGAIKVSATKPFLWASGTYNPIYNDNRMFLFYPQYRKLIADSFCDLIASDSSMVGTSIIAGTSTAGIAPGMLLAERLGLSFIYIRDKRKNHGKMNRIEGIGDNQDLDGREVLLIEDLISTGGSSVSAVSAVREASGNIINCFSIFNYGLPKAEKMFSGKIPFGKDERGESVKLGAPCQVISLLYFDQLFKIGVENGAIKENEIPLLKQWIKNQEHWGEANGFPTIRIK